MVYPGTGGLPPSVRKKSSGGPTTPKPYGFGLYEDLPSGKRKKIQTLRLQPGEKNVPVMFLDEAKFSTDAKTLAAPSILIHDGIRFNNTFGNMIICTANSPEGCPLDVALQRKHTHAHWCKESCDREGKMEPTRGAWRWVATVIKFQPYTATKGPMAGKTLPFQRLMLLAPDAKKEQESIYAQLCAYREQFGSLRGRIFNVRRSDDKFSAKCGTVWTPTGSRMTDEEMMEKFEESAEIYGLRVEQFIRPFDYEKVLAPLPADKLRDAAKWIAAENGVSLDGAPVASGELPTSSPAADYSEEIVDDDEDGDTIPF